MSTILTVHGTFASGPEAGTAWWQRGSTCCHDIADLVEGEDGQLKIEQVIWDGRNSERSRQTAGAALLERMNALDQAGESYCVIGHSHGGSVIAAALLRAVRYKRPLDKLARWITIGTPFIEAERSRMLFARLGPAGKTVFLSILAYLIASVLFFGFESDDDKQIFALGSYKLAAMAGMLIFVLTIGYPVLWALARNRLYWHDRRAQAAAAKAFGPRWLSLRHEADEAVQGLGALGKLKHPIFPTRFAVDPISRAAIFAVPVAVYFAMSSLGLNTAQERQKTFDEQKILLQEQKRLSQEQAVGTAQQPTVRSDPKQPRSKEPVGAAGKPFDPQSQPGWALGAEILLGFVAMIGILVGIPMLMYHMLRLVALPTSWALSHVMNSWTWSQLRRSGLGSDIDGEVGRRAAARPVWLELGNRPLPPALAAEILEISNKAAAISIAKFRDALSDLGFYQLEKDGKDALNEFLCGDELIHTTYFKIPRFRKLTAYAIAQSPGFRPSAAFQTDADYATVKEWYDWLVARDGPYRAAAP